MKPTFFSSFLYVCVGILAGRKQKYDIMCSVLALSITSLYIHSQRSPLAWQVCIDKMLVYTTTLLFICHFSDHACVWAAILYMVCAYTLTFCIEHACLRHCVHASFHAVTALTMVHLLAHAEAPMG